MKEKNLRRFANLAAELAIAHACIEVLEEELEEARHPKPIIDAEDPGPKATRQNSIEVKTTGQLIDELVIMNQRIWVLIDKVIAGVATPEEAQNVQKYNAKRNEYVRAIDRRLSGEDIGAKIYGS